jgi:hypothetical protein
MVSHHGGYEMTNDPNYVPEEELRHRSIDFIRKKWGSLADLPKHVVPVIWVMTYRCLEVTMKAEANGGHRGLMKNMLIGDTKRMPQLQEAIIKIDYLEKMISLFRSTPSPLERAIDGHVLVDVLKWGIDGTKSGLRRTIARQFAKADPEYKKPIPPEISL